MQNRYFSKYGMAYERSDIGQRLDDVPLATQSISQTAADPFMQMGFWHAVTLSRKMFATPSFMRHARVERE